MAPVPRLPDDGQNDEQDAIRQDLVVQDLTIIQAQAQMVLRRIDVGKMLDPEDLRKRMESIVKAVQEIAALTHERRN